MQNYCAEIKLRAERKAGEILAANGRKPGDTDKSIRSHDATTLPPPKLSDLGITKSDSSRRQPSRLRLMRLSVEMSLYF